MGIMLAAGLAVVSMPVLLGALADEVGPRRAHLWCRVSSRSP
jgi:hypothetical protein